MSKVSIYDTTLRDGAQSVGIAFSIEDKIRITSELDGIGVQYIEGGWPGSNPKDGIFFKEVSRLSLENAKLAAFSSTRQKNQAVTADENIKKLISSGAPVVTVFGKSWDLHVNLALKTTLEENLAMITDTIAYLKNYFREVIFDAEHFFDGFKENRDYALQTLYGAASAGADWVVLCDTNGGTLPCDCDDIVTAVKKELSVPLGIHTHNDSELAVANSLIAVEKGVRMVQGTINGIGERCGNANLCSIIPNLSLKAAYQTIPREKIKRIYYVSRLVSELSNHRHPKNLPFVGGHAFAHKGGVHVSAVRQATRTYEHIDPELVGNTRVISISELSGRSNILEKALDMGLNPDKNCPSVARVLEKLKELESQGYYFEGAEASFELLYKRMLGQLKDYFFLQGNRVIIWKNADGKAWSEATIKAHVPEEICRQMGITEPIEHTSADGNGPVEALDRALRKVLEKFYPHIKEVKLVDYKVRILNEGSGTSATTRVIINSRDEKRRWSTVGVSENIIDASWQALTDSLIYKLMKDDEEKEKP